MTDLTMEGVVETYLKLRTQKEVIEAQAKQDAVSIKEKLVKIEQWIKAESDRTGTTSFKTAAGTAFLSTSDFASVADWDQVLAFVRENDAYDLLTKGVSKTSVRQHIDANKTVPPGVNFGTKIGVSVRKPTKKA